MKTIKIIDLLNKIANGEEVPKKIAIQNDVLIYNEKHYLYLQDYYHMSDEENATWQIWAYKLNEEAEIIEEKKIPEKLGFTAYVEGEISYSWSKSEAFLKTKINEIIDYLESKEKGE